MRKLSSKLKKRLLKEVEEKVAKTEEKLQQTLNDLDSKISSGFFYHFVKYSIATSSDLEQLSVKVKPLLLELGFTKPCSDCHEVFKTERQVRNHKKEKHVDEEE